MRLDRDVLAWLKGYGEGYSTRINRILRGHGRKTSQRRQGLRVILAPLEIWFDRGKFVFKLSDDGGRLIA